jgi:CheY-like chemotaxis protein
MGETRVFDVLVVDDDPADTMMIQAALETVAEPPRVHHVVDGSEAMEYLRREGPYCVSPRPDLILLDLNMPRMSGHEVLAALKTDDDLKTIPVVVLTTSTAARDVTDSYVRHANAYVTKPMDLDAFETAVRKIKVFYSDVAVLPS